MEMQQKNNSTQRNIPGTIAQNASFTTFLRAVDQAGLKETLAGTGPFTVFAPTNAAFDKLPAGKLDYLFKPENKDELASIVNYHLINGRKSAADVGKWENARTLNGQPAPIQLSRGQLSIDGAQVTSPDIATSNGVIHGIDKVNIPAANSAEQKLN